MWEIIGNIFVFINISLGLISIYFHTRTLMISKERKKLLTERAEQYLMIAYSSYITGATSPINYTIKLRNDVLNIIFDESESCTIINVYGQTERGLKVDVTFSTKGRPSFYAFEMDAEYHIEKILQMKEEIKFEEMIK